jgi:hypothetical protein
MFHFYEVKQDTEVKNEDSGYRKIKSINFWDAKKN